MNKKIFIFARLLFQLLFFCIATEALAQSASKQINEIKRNEAYLFEEATAATAKEARDLAVVKLAKIIADYMEEINPEGAAKLDDFKDLAEGAEEIVTDRGSQKRVFLYFSKHDIDATAEEASQTDAHGEGVEKSDPLPEQIVEQPKKTKEADVPVREDLAPEPIPEQVVRQPEIMKKDNYSANESHSNKSVSDDSLAEWQKRLISNFLRDDLSLLAAKDLVNTYKIENKIKRYGSMTNPPTQSGQAFYVFADETGKVVAVLGRDQGGQRLNYINGNYENISDYNSLNYIWFTLNK